MSRGRAVAPSNIAFVKYWGAVDLDRGLPRAPSISMTLDRCVSHCSVETLEGADADAVFRVENEEAVPADRAFEAGVVRHLDRLREATASRARFRVETFNTFPTGAGLASSASGFAALALAVADALGSRPTARELSVLARLSGSGSAARSVLGGYVEWPGDAGDPASPARQLAPAEHWDLRDLVAVVDARPKEVSSRDGHRRAASSPYFERRLEELPGRLERARRAIRERDFAALAEVVEEDAVDLHLIAMSSRPPIFYWEPATLAVVEAARFLRRSGVECCFTIDAGPNVHVLCPAPAEEAVARALSRVAGVERVIRDRVGAGPYVPEEG